MHTQFIVWFVKSGHIYSTLRYHMKVLYYTFFAKPCPKPNPPCLPSTDQIPAGTVLIVLIVLIKLCVHVANLSNH